MIQTHYVIKLLQDKFPDYQFEVSKYCMYKTVDLVPPEIPQANFPTVGHTPLDPNLEKWPKNMQVHLVYLSPTGGLLLKNTLNLSGHFMHTGLPSGTRLIRKCMIHDFQI